ncbi:hypothetical protein EOM33_04270, partial [Candidatus Saccharibacteria bacterium]|nr:hypothetical protein [Candidatus Saccharibacteria bacterium]
MIDGTVLWLVVAAVIIAAVLFIIMRFMPYSANIDKEKYQSRWLEIEHGLNPGSRDSQYMAILKADKLLDQVLRDTGSKGQTMGERMKSRQNAWSNANAVWAAHKIRNQIAHDENVQLSETTVRRALASFKQALKD